MKRKHKPTSYINFWIGFQLIGGTLSAILMWYIVTYVFHINLLDIFTILK